jgi:hypothetical protein
MACSTARHGECPSTCLFTWDLWLCGSQSCRSTHPAVLLRNRPPSPLLYLTTKRFSNKIYHPNIDLEGSVCLNILREDWKPVLSLNSVMIGIQYLFLEPNASDPLNKEAAMELQKNKDKFKRLVALSMEGQRVGGETFDRVK